MNNQMATNKIQELEKENRGLELEVRFNKRRLEMETLAAREVNEKPFLLYPQSDNTRCCNLPFLDLIHFIRY